VSRSLVIVLALLLTGACAGRRGDTSTLPVEPFAGHVTATPNSVWFVPCGAAEGARRFCVTWVDASVRQAHEANEARAPRDERASLRTLARFQDR
jgi:hypothetical protein